MDNHPTLQSAHPVFWKRLTALLLVLGTLPTTGCFKTVFASKEDNVHYIGTHDRISKMKSFDLMPRMGGRKQTAEITDGTDPFLQHETFNRASSHSPSSQGASSSEYEQYQQAKTYESAGVTSLD